MVGSIVKEVMLPVNTRPRLIALDTFRGMTIFLMIVVNTPGGPGLPFGPLIHADWNGCTLADLVFPSFLFAMGNAMIFAAQKWRRQQAGQIVYAILRRSLFIFLIGYLLTWYCSMSGVPDQIHFVSFSDTRIMAVLQRIAICYLLAGLIIHFLKLRALIAVCILLLVGYWIVLYAFGKPGFALSEEGNLVRQLDILLLGENHMYRERGIIFDPEGLLSTLPATVNVLIGYLAGLWLTQKGKLRVLMLTGFALIAIALLWNLNFPFNKKLWTSSFVLFTSGIDLIVLGILFYLTEIKAFTFSVHFFTVLGKNPLFIYVLSNILLVILIWHVHPNEIFIDWINAAVFQKIAPGATGSLLFALTFTLFCWFIAWMMDKKKIYIRI